VVTIRNDNARGLSGARNAGIAASVGEVIAFVDDDAEVQPNWAQKIRAHYGEPDVAGVGGHAQPVWPDARPIWLPREYDWVVGCSHNGLPTAVTPVRNFIGCNMSFRRQVLDSVGLFNTGVGRIGNNPVGCEETELCIRISQADTKARLILDPGVIVNHHVSRDRVRFTYFVRRCYSEGLSKYRVSNTVGADDALRSERHYVAKVLPIAFLTGIWSSVTGRGGRGGPLARSVAIVVGLHVTALGYLYSMLRAKLGAAP
jgi:GT2 family glycosyltransferase